MARLRSYRIILMFFEAIIGISATTHWVVTENGRIQPQVSINYYFSLNIYYKSINYLIILFVKIVVFVYFIYIKSMVCLFDCMCFIFVYD